MCGHRAARCRDPHYFCRKDRCGGRGQRRTSSILRRSGRWHRQRSGHRVAARPSGYSPRRFTERVSRMRTGVNRIAPAHTSGSESLSALLGERAVNLRQIILRAHRGMNRRIAEKFAERGFAEIGPFRLSVLANMNLGDTEIRDLVDRAQITDNGVSELVAEL